MVRKPDSDVRGPLVLYNFGGKGGGEERLRREGRRRGVGRVVGTRAVLGPQDHALLLLRAEGYFKDLLSKEEGGAGLEACNSYNTA